MAVKHLAITAAQVREFLALAGKEISCTVDHGSELASQNLDRMDVVHVLRSVEVVKHKEGKLHGAEMVATGLTCDGAMIRVTFKIDRQTGEIIVRSVDRI